MADNNLPTGTVTFLFSDIEGSTRLLQTLGRERFVEALESHHRLVRDAVGDAVVSTEGDSFFCAFRTPVEAITAAVGVQRSLDNHDWPDGATVRVRMGVHTGEGIRGGDDYVGLDVHRAARISAAAHGGQVLVSAATHAQVGTAPGDGLAFRDLGEHQLKDLAEPEHLYQLIAPGLRHDFPPIESLGAARTNLPEQLSTFVGREREITELVDAARQSRLVTVTGAGGAGKTRLAIEAGRAAVADYAGGVFFSSLADIEDERLVAAHVASALSITEQVGRPIEETIADYLRPRAALLILDNCEHLADAAADLAESLLIGCPDLAVVVTSREPLHVAGEQIFEVGPMQIVDESDHGVTAANSEAVRLFAARASEVAPRFDVAAWAKQCAEICRRLDAIPLAIELAAARVNVLTPQEILDRLDDRFALLTGTRRRSAGRHGTLRSAIDWSYDLLDDTSQQLLQSLSIFRGGFSLEAARVVCFGEDASEGIVLDLLGELRAKSLVTQQTGFLGTRFGMLETIREYAFELLNPGDEFASTAERHQEYFIDIAGRLGRQLTEAGQLEALELLEADHDNFRAVMRRALAEGRFEDAARMAGRLVWFWYLHSHFTEGERWAGALLNELPDDPSTSWMRLLLGSAQFDSRTGRSERAYGRLALALDASKKANAQRVELWAHAYKATNDLYQLRLDDAKEEAAAAVAVARELGDFAGLGYASYLQIGAEAWAVQEQGALTDERRALLLEQLEPIGAASRAVGDRNMIGHVLQVEGLLAAYVGDTARAVEAFDTALASLTDLGTVGCTCHCLEAVAGFFADKEQFRIAARVIGAADGLRSRVGISVSPLEAEIRERAIAHFGAAMSSAEIEAERAAGSPLGLVESAHLARQTLARI